MVRERQNGVPLPTDIGETALSIGQSVNHGAQHSMTLHNDGVDVMPLPSPWFVFRKAPMLSDIRLSNMSNSMLRYRTENHVYQGVKEHDALIYPISIRTSPPMHTNHHFVI